MGPHVVMRCLSTRRIAIALALASIAASSCFSIAHSQTVGLVEKMEAEIASEEAAEKDAGRPPRLECPEKPSLLFPAEKQWNIKQVMEGNTTGLIRWDPPEDKYLILHCRLGQISNRIICIRNHIILAGLLNRTLVVDPDDKSMYRYDLSIIFDVNHARRCFGPRAVKTTNDYSIHHARQKLNLDAFACWAVWTHFNLRTVKVFPPVCSTFACRTVDLDDYNRTLTFHNLTRDTACIKTMDEIVTYYTTKWNSTRTILVGTLPLIGAILPKEYTSYGDAPFLRQPDCPNTLAILPHHDIVAHAEDLVAKTFDGEPFLAVHIRRGDFLTDRCERKLGWKTACFTMREIATCIADELQATGITNLVICSDAQKEESAALQSLLQDALKDQPIRIIFNPMLPDFLKDPMRGGRGEGPASLHKVLMAKGAVFFGTDHSTFTADVERMRLGFGTASCRDSFICDRGRNRVKALDPYVSFLL